MIANLQPYPEYKESDLPWLGGVPRHWQSGPGFAAFREKQVKNTGVREKTVLSLSYGRIVVKSPEKLHGLVPDSFETYQIVDPGDIIIRSTDLQNDWNSLRVGLVRNRGIITSAYLCFRTTGTLSPEYGYQLLHAFDLMKVFYGLGSGLRQNLDWSDFKRMPILMPPPEEQAAMVRFLDYANGRLERAIRAKRKVIALLHEQKQAIIHRAVTRGLNADAPLKPSGIPWLGEIPKHWEIAPFKSRVSFREGPGIMLADFRQRGVPLLRISCLLSKEHGLDGCNYLDPVQVAKRWSHFAVQHGDYILNASTSASTVIVCKARDEMLGAIPYTGLIRLWPKTSGVVMAYVAWLIQSPLIQSQLMLNRAGVGIAHFGPTHLKRMWLALPPRAEQETLADWIRNKTAALDLAIARVEREIALLREYRTRLVADVVTGKLDVRPAAAKLPAESVGPEPSPEPEGSEASESEPEQVM